jgi:multidrug efflux system outer membrane protein
VAAAYLQLAADRSVLAITRDTLRAAESSVAVTKVRLDGGIAPRTDLRQAETVLATAQANEARAVTAIAEDRNALELLVGGSVADALLPPSIEAVEGHVGELPAGLDSAILLRRPDVAQAEYQLWAANARIGAARAAFLPRISLTGVLGFASTALSGLFDGGAKSWTATPQVTLPIFDGGANSGNLAYAKAQQAVYLAGYERAIQAAFRDVADALARRGTIEPELAVDRRNLGAAEDSHTLAEARYQQGIDPYLSVLDAQRTLYAAQLRLVSSRLSRVQNLVDLYRSLGGDQTLDVATDTSGMAH